MQQKVLLPLPLFKKAIEVLNTVCNCDFNHDFRKECYELLWEFERQLQHIELQEAYSCMILAADPATRKILRDHYLGLKENFQIPF